MLSAARQRRPAAPAPAASASETAKLGIVEPTARSGGFVWARRSVHHDGPERVQPLVEGEADEPGGEQHRAEGRRPEDVLLGVVGAAHEPVAEEHAEERDEERAEEQQERLVRGEVDHQRAERGHGRDGRDEQPLRDAGRGVLQRDAGRVDVREGLVGLVDGDGQERERAREAGGGDGGRQRGGVVEAPAEDEDDAEQEHPGGGHEVPDRDAGEGAAPVAREAGVVRDERDPRDGERDDEVDRDPQREAALARAVPEPRRGRRRRSPTT